MPDAEIEIAVKEPPVRSGFVDHVGEFLRCLVDLSRKLLREHVQEVESDGTFILFQSVESLDVFQTLFRIAVEELEFGGHLQKIRILRKRLQVFLKDLPGQHIPVALVGNREPHQERILVAGRRKELHKFCHPRVIGERRFRIDLVPQILTDSRTRPLAHVVERRILHDRFESRADILQGVVVECDLEIDQIREVRQNDAADFLHESGEFTFSLLALTENVQRVEIRCQQTGS